MIGRHELAPDWFARPARRQIIFNLPHPGSTLTTTCSSVTNPTDDQRRSTRPTTRVLPCSLCVGDMTYALPGLVGKICRFRVRRAER